MIIDSKDIEQEAVLDADICIVGAGAAGITIAREFFNTDTKVLLLESGGLEYDNKTQDMNKGEFEGNTFEKASGESYLRNLRQRYLGGNTNCWRGWCGKLDKEDFEKRDWIPNSGWPIKRDELDPYYDKALTLFNIHPFEIDGREYEEKSGVPVFPDASVIRNRILHQSEYRFGKTYKEELNKSKNITLLLHSNVVDLVTNGDGNSINKIIVSSLQGRKFTVSPKVCVLATGGIENARLLLASNRKLTPNGLGNTHDNVGRYFMEHFTVWNHIEIVMRKGYYPNSSFRHNRSNKYKHEVVQCHNTSHATQKKEKMANFQFFHWEDYEKKPSEMLKFQKLTQAWDHPKKAELIAANKLWVGPVNTVTEIVPTAENRVMLSNQLDPLGGPAVKLVLNLTEFDLHTVNRSLEIFAIELMKHKRGEARINKKIEAGNMQPGPHHMGATRMHESPKKGVVDKDCRVFGLDNLYIAGSSVFTTGSSVNPTYTIGALAIRIADTIKKVHV